MDKVLEKISEMVFPFVDSWNMSPSCILFQEAFGIMEVGDWK